MSAASSPSRVARRARRRAARRRRSGRDAASSSRRCSQNDVADRQAPAGRRARSEDAARRRHAGARAQHRPLSAARSGRWSPRPATCATSPSTAIRASSAMTRGSTSSPTSSRSVENEGDRVFTFTLREGHQWSDGEPFTTEDFRYYWEDIANNAELSPSGPPDLFLVDGKLPKVEILDERHIRYSWDRPNPRFLPSLAMPRPDLHLFAGALPEEVPRQICRPGQARRSSATKKKLTSWAALHNKLDDPYEAGNVDMPVLDPWRIVTKAPAQRFIFERNPYFHRVDPQGHQLPYVDRIVVDIAASGPVRGQGECRRGRPPRRAACRRATFRSSSRARPCTITARCSGRSPAARPSRSIPTRRPTTPSGGR